MIDMHRGRTTRWEYVRVSWPGFDELGQVEGVSTHDIDESVESTTKVDGTMEYVGMPELGDDMVRIYAVMEQSGEAERMCVATMRVSTGSEDVENGVRSGTADLYSTLTVMDKALAESTYVLKQGANIVQAAEGLARSCRLPVTATPSGKTASKDYTWDIGTSFLEIANDLLDMAGYGSCGVDSYGTVVMAPYESPSDKAEADTFSDSAPDVCDALVRREFDRMDVPNVVIVTSSDGEGNPVSGTAVNDNPADPYSTESRAMRIGRVEAVDGLESDAECDAKAAELLKSGMSVTETLTVGHAGKRFDVGDAVRMDYRRSGLTEKYGAYKRSSSGTPDMDSETVMRRSVRLYG